MLKRRYGMTLDDYETMLASQNGVCAICKKPETHQSRGSEVQPLSVDHSHTTKRVRGLICDSCNKGIQAFRDDPELIQRAIEFLENDQTMPTMQADQADE